MIAPQLVPGPIWPALFVKKPANSSAQMTNDQSREARDGQSWYGAPSAPSSDFAKNQSGIGHLSLGFCHSVTIRKKVCEWSRPSSVSTPA